MVCLLHQWLAVQHWITHLCYILTSQLVSGNDADEANQIISYTFKRLGSKSNNFICITCKTTSNAYDILAKFLKLSANSLCSWLSKFFNKCIAKGAFPNLLKVAQITPIAKITTPNSNDYRPISILPSLYKVFEKPIYSSLYFFVTSNGILSPLQYGFCTYHSTELTIAAKQTTIYTCV